MKLRSGFVQVHPPLPSRARALWRGLWRGFWRGALAVLVAAAAIAAALAALCWHLLQPQPGEWSQGWRAGPLHGRLSMPTAIRLATHPMGLRLLDGRRLDTPGGQVRLRLDADGRTLHATCAPCELRLAALGNQPLRVQRAVWTVTRRMPDDFTGSVQLDGAAPGATLRAAWSARIAADGTRFTLSLPAAPVRDYYRVLAPDLPELRAARIAGTAAFELRAVLPQGRWELHPQVEGLRVEGLGTEALRSARFDAACPLPAAPGGDPAAADAAMLAGFGRWLPRAVIAAEDQRFYEHPGYDLDEMLHAWSANQRMHDGRGPAGASTLSQQLAKLLFTGDERSWRRKARELLWAVELDRTLGKARVLQAYLSVAPWGEGRCGAQAAARHYLNKPAAALTPMEAAWLAGMLNSPDAQAQRWRTAQQVDGARIARIVDGMRPLPRAERARLVAQAAQWKPQPQPQPRVVVARAAVRKVPRAQAARQDRQVAQGASEGARAWAAQGGRAGSPARAPGGAASGPSREGVAVAALVDAGTVRVAPPLGASSASLGQDLTR